MTAKPQDRPISVIVVEDDAPLRDEMVAFLTARDITVRSAATGTEFWRLFEDEAPNAVVLDLGLPGDDGVAIAQALRKQSPSIGLVMATGRDSVADRILGYETGANVYLVKPVDLGELLAAVRSTVRTPLNAPQRPQIDAPAPAEWQFDPTAWKLVGPTGRSIQLTRAETILVDCLSERPGEAVSRYEISDRMGKTEDLPDHRFVDQTVRRLRRKIEADLEIDPPIRSAHAVGYSFIGTITRI